MAVSNESGNKERIYNPNLADRDGFDTEEAAGVPTTTTLTRPLMLAGRLA